MSKTADLPDCHLTKYVETEDRPTHEMAVVNLSHPDPVDRMVENLFDRQPVELVDVDESEFDDDTVILLEDGEVIASSPLKTLLDSILMVNSDVYKTGTVGLEEIEIPEVIAELSETTFHVRGYPESDQEKMPLILISRYIERLSYFNGGTHRASFQNLSRINDEKGTERVYRKIGERCPNVHVYGVPDSLPPRELGVKIHSGYGGDFDSSWFVLHNSEEESAVLVAVEVGANEWKGYWTFEDGAVSDVEETIKEYL